MNAFSPARLAVSLRRTTPLDRIAALILVLYVLVRVAVAFRIRIPFSGALGFVAFLAVLYFLYRLSAWVRIHFMWSLRNRLLVAYVFIAVVPVVLLLTMVGVGSYLLYLQLGAHLLHDDLQDRITSISTTAASLANAVEREQSITASSSAAAAVLSRPAILSIEDAARAQWPDLRVAYAPGINPLVRSGEGRHFAGLVEEDRKIEIAAAVTRTGSNGPFSVLVTAPLTSAVLDGLTSDLGPVQMALLSPAGSSTDASGQVCLDINDQRYCYSPDQEIASRHRALRPPANFLDVRVSGAATLEAVELAPPGDPANAHAAAQAAPRSQPPSLVRTPIMAYYILRPSSLNRRLFSSVGALGPFLLVILILSAAIFLLLEIGALITGVVLTRTITSAVSDLYQATLHVRRGDFGHRVRTHQRDQLGALGDSFNEMTTSITGLIEDQRQRQRLENEIAIAREVQEQLFPREIPSLPNLQLAAICRAARSVSGDYYDFIRLSPTRVAIAVADISGKGIFAALLMASLQASLRSQAPLATGCDTADLVSRVNTHLFRNTSDDRYATFFYAVYDSEEKSLTYTNAGHLAPILLSDSGCEFLDQGGTVVGLFEEYQYTQVTKKLTPGTILVAFSDGLTEPENVYGEEFGTDRVKAEVIRQRLLPVATLATNLIASAEQWAGSAEQADDITVVVARIG
ncbi:MAG: SpoIIE family protein phosphatase [Candidatus Acidiferrales bacterium]